MKELCWVHQFVTLKDIMLARLMIRLLESYFDQNMELHWDLQIELQLDLN